MIQEDLEQSSLTYVTASIRRDMSETTKLLSKAKLENSTKKREPKLQLKSLAIMVWAVSESIIKACNLARQSTYNSRLSKSP